MQISLLRLYVTQKLMQGQIFLHTVVIFDDDWVKLFWMDCIKITVDSFVI